MFEIAFLSGNNGIADYEHRWDEHEDRPPAAKHQRECKVEERGRAVPRVTRKSVWPRGRKRFGGQSGWNRCSDLPECCKLPADIARPRPASAIAATTAGQVEGHGHPSGAAASSQSPSSNAPKKIRGGGTRMPAVSSVIFGLPIFKAFNRFTGSIIC